MPVIEKVERVSRAIEKEGLIAHVKLNDTQQMIRAINSLVVSQSLNYRSRRPSGKTS
jgi:hypothetical protein